MGLCSVRDSADRRPAPAAPACHNPPPSLFFDTLPWHTHMVRLTLCARGCFAFPFSCRSAACRLPGRSAQHEHPVLRVGAVRSCTTFRSAGSRVPAHSGLSFPARIRDVLDTTLEVV